MDSVIKCVLEIMADQGRDLSAYDESFLKKTLEKRLEQTQVRDADGYCRLLRENGAEAYLFSDALHITYSCFFREPFSFALIEKKLAGLIESKATGGEIRIWSAGCAEGQEAYSIAMLLDENISARGGGMRYRIFATDISADALSFARKGAYRPEALKGVQLGQLEKYFAPADGVYRVFPFLKEKISFFEYDLLDRNTAYPAESIFGNFDIVFCRNVLLYYNAAQRRFMMQKLARSLADGGILAVGEAERSIAAQTAGLDAVCPSAAVFIKSKKRG